MPEFELTVHVHEGRHFPRSEEDFYRIGGLFDEEPRSTARSMRMSACPGAFCMKRTPCAFVHSDFPSPILLRGSRHLGLAQHGTLR